MAGWRLQDARRRRRAGRIEAISPAFLTLGGAAGLVYQVLGPDEARAGEVARMARLSAPATSQALRVLAEHWVPVTTDPRLGAR